MVYFPKIEKVARETTLVHFFLLFGYKIFSLYFPLFLISKGFSLPQAGFAYLLIYLPIALFSPLAGFLNRKTNPAFLVALGVFGYGFYSLAMLLTQNNYLFLFWQIVLGVSAALFFVSSRTILINSSLENPDRAFGWFYSAPFYVDALAPALGALLIWQFGFGGVFIFSLAIHSLNGFFAFFVLKGFGRSFSDGRLSLSQAGTNYKQAFLALKSREMAPFILISFSVLLTAALYRAFFVLFLKDSLLWSQKFILLFISLSSILFLPISLFLIRRLAIKESRDNVIQGGLLSGLGAFIFGMAVPVLGFFSVLAINFLRMSGSLVCNAGRSGLVSQKLKRSPETAGALDTVFSPLGMALGSLLFGFLIGFAGYRLIFILAGIFIIFVVFAVRLARR